LPLYKCDVYKAIVFKDLRDFFDLLKLSQIILTTREEEDWFKSWKNQLQIFNTNFHLRMMWSLSPMGWAFYRFFENCRKSKRFWCEVCELKSILLAFFYFEIRSFVLMYSKQKEIPCTSIRKQSKEC